MSNNVKIGRSEREVFLDKKWKELRVLLSEPRNLALLKRMKDK